MQHRQKTDKDPWIVIYPCAHPVPNKGINTKDKQKAGASKINKLSNVKIKKKYPLANHFSSESLLNRLGGENGSLSTPQKKISNRRRPTVPRSNDKHEGNVYNHGPLVIESAVTRSRDQDGGQEHRGYNPAEGGKWKKPKMRPRAKQRTRRKGKGTEKEHTVTHGTLLNRILTHGFGKSSGRGHKTDGLIEV